MSTFSSSALRPLPVSLRTACNLSHEIPRRLSAPGRARMPLVSSTSRPMWCAASSAGISEPDGHGPSEDNSASPLPVGVTAVSLQAGNGTEQPTPSTAELQLAMQVAAQREDYETAARLRDMIREVVSQDPVMSLKQQLETSIDEEEYEVAAELRDRLRGLGVDFQADEGESSQLSYSHSTQSSSTITNGIRVEVESHHVPDHSCPEQSRYFFSYRVKITNEGDDVVQIKSRHWVIIDGNGHMEQVRGPGVVGEQPILSPGQSFEYTSACPLRTEHGTMQGEYDLDVWDDYTEDWTYKITARIGKFALRADAAEAP